jgi:hypothetical protein
MLAVAGNFRKFSEGAYRKILATLTFWRGTWMAVSCSWNAKIFSLLKRQARLQSSYQNSAAKPTRKGGRICWPGILKRVRLTNEHKAAFSAHLKLGETIVDGALVFAHTVPMSFAADQIAHAVTLLTYDRLEEFCRFNP